MRQTLRTLADIHEHCEDARIAEDDNPEHGFYVYAMHNGQRIEYFLYGKLGDPTAFIERRTVIAG